MKWVVVAVLSAAAAVAVLWLTGVARLPFAALRPHPAAPQPVLVALPQVTSNLQSSSGVHFVEVTMTVKLQDKADAKALQQHEAAVQDAVLMTLRSQSVSSLNGPAGMSTLASLLTKALDQAIGVPGAVEAVYFTQFLVD